MSYQDKDSWAAIPDTAKFGLKIAGGVVLVPIAVVLIFVYLKGFGARAWTSNLFYALFVVWLPLMIWMECFLRRVPFDRFLPSTLAEPARDHCATALSMSLIFAILALDPEMSTATALLTYVWSFFAMLSLFIAGILIGIAVQNIWERLRGSLIER